MDQKRSHERSTTILLDIVLRGHPSSGIRISDSDIWEYIIYCIWWYSVRNILSDSAKILIRIVMRCPPIRHIVRLCSDRMFDRVQGKIPWIIFDWTFWLVCLNEKSSRLRENQGRSMNSLWKTLVLPNFPVMMVEVLKVHFFKITRDDPSNDVSLRSYVWIWHEKVRF